MGEEEWWQSEEDESLNEAPPKRTLRLERAGETSTTDCRCCWSPRRDWNLLGTMHALDGELPDGTLPLLLLQLSSVHGGPTIGGSGWLCP